MIRLNPLKSLNASFVLMLILSGTFHGKKDLSDDRELAAALGDMLVAWSNAEDALQNVFKLMTDMSWEMIQAGYFAIPTLRSRAEFLKSMLKEWEQDTYDADEISRQIDKLYRLAKTRNDWVHGQYAGRNFSGGTVIFDMKEERGSNKRLRNMKTSDVRSHVDAVQKRADKIRELVTPPKWR